MNFNKKTLSNPRLLERRKFFNIVANMDRANYFARKKAHKLSPGNFRLTLAFTPEELGLDCLPTEELIQKVGIKRALERTNRKDFITTVSVVAKGNPDKETIARIRSEVLESTKKKFRADGTVDLTAFGTSATTGENNEVESNGITTTEI